MDGSIPSRRPQDFRTCHDDGNWNEDPAGTTANVRRQPWGVAPIEFLYSIETNISPLVLSPREKETILNSLSSAIVESIYEYDCPPQRGRKRRRQSSVSSLPSSLRSRRAEIISISPGAGHEWLGECDSKLSRKDNDNGDASFCNEIGGNVVIAFDGKGSESTASDFKSVGNIVLSRIEEDMINGNYLDKVNNDMRMFGITLNRMDFIESNYPDLVARDSFSYLNTNSGSSHGNKSQVGTVNMTLFSKVAIPIMVVLFLLAMGFCWCAILSCPTDLFFAKKNIYQENRENKDEDAGSTNSNNHSQPNVDRDTKTSNMKKSNPFSAFNKKKNNSDADEGRNENNEKETLRILSLEDTLQDLSDTEYLKYGEQNAVHSMSSSNQKSYPSLPARSSRSLRKSSLNTKRFLPVSVRDRPQSRNDLGDGTLHSSDTETGSSGHSVDINKDMKHHIPTGSKVDLMKKTNRNSTPIRALSALFSKGVSNDAPHAPAPEMNVIDRISACTSIRNSHCCAEGSEKNKDSTMFRYVIPTDERCNSLLETPPPQRHESRIVQTAAESPLYQMGVKKSAAYREYINKKMLQREAECEELDTPGPMEIGVKRTFTDSQGRIREMVAL